MVMTAAERLENCADKVSKYLYHISLMVTAIMSYGYTFESVNNIQCFHKLQNEIFCNFVKSHLQAILLR